MDFSAFIDIGSISNGIHATIAYNLAKDLIIRLKDRIVEPRDIAELNRIVDAQEYQELNDRIRDGLKRLVQSYNTDHEALIQSLVNLQEAIESKFPPVVKRLDPMLASWERDSQDTGLSPSAPLKAKYGVVPFIPRHAEMEDLQAWCEGEKGGRRIALRLYTGAGGMGKTRFMIEACTKARELGWKAGFLRESDDNGLDGFTYGSQSKVLVVLDYAERRSTAVVKLLKGFLANTEAPKVRVVLLARADGDWWQGLQRADEALEGLFGLAGVFSLQAPSGMELDRAEAYRDAVNAFTHKLGKDIPASPPPDLSKPEFERILILHMAALLAVDGDKAGSEDEILEGLAKREERYLEKQLEEKKMPPSLNQTLFRASVLATLVGGASSVEQAQKLVVPRTSERVVFQSYHQESLAMILLNTYPGPTRGSLSGIEPDLFGEYMVCRWLKDKQDTALLTLATKQDWGEKAVNHTLTVLTRIAQRRKEDGETWLKQTLALDLERLLPLVLDVAQETGDPIGQVAAKVLERYSAKDEEQQKRAVELAILIYGKLPDQTTTLRELALAVTKVLYQAAKSRLDAGESEAQEVVALFAGNLGVRLSELGHREDALQATEEAVATRRKLAEQRPDAFLPNLAMALNNLGNWYSDLGHREDALQATLEALTIYKKLAEERTEAFLPDLARTLNNLGRDYSNLGRREDALAATKEAVTIYRRLAEQHPDAFLPDLARALNNLGMIYSNLGRREDALQATQDALTIYRKLAKERPDAFLPDLAVALNNLGNSLSELGRREDALQATQEAVTIRRKLAQERPDAFLPNLADSLNNMGIRYSDLGRREDALQATQDALTIYRKLAKERSDAFLPNLATALSNLGAMYSNLGRREDALQATQDAVTIRRKLAKEHPDAFLPDLATALNNLGAMYSNLGRREDALQATQDALTIYRKLAKERPDAFLPDLAVALNNLGNSLSELGRREDALQATQEALTIRRKLAEERPDAFLPNLADSLNNMGIRYSDLGRREDALQATQDALTIYRKLAKERSDAFLPNLATALSNISVDYSNLGRREDALQATQEAVTIRRKLAKEHPDAFLPNLANSLSNKADFLLQLEKADEALPNSHQALQLFTPFFLQYARAHEEWMREFVDVYQKCCQALNQPPDMALLSPILEKLKKLKQEQENQE